MQKDKITLINFLKIKNPVVNNRIFFCLDATNLHFKYLINKDPRLQSPIFNTMKKLIWFGIALFCCVSCSLNDDNNTTFTYELVPITAAEIPDTLIYHNTYLFDITYQRPSDCHFFEGFSYEAQGNERIIGVVNGVYENPTCQIIDSLTAEVSLKFIVERNDFYTFKFWQGEDADGESIFITKEVPVKIE